MRAVLIAATGLVALAASSPAAQAADGCGRGFYYNGYRCAPMYGQRYRDYDEGARFYYRERPVYRYDRDRGHPYGYRYNYGDPRCGRPNYTIQDGVCKPYTGR
jgi:hypothetical protein